MKNTAKLLVGVMMAAFTLGAVAQDSPHYKDGPVTYVSYIKTKSGKFDDYVAFLDTQYKTLMTANKKAGLILDFKVFAASPRNSHEPNVILTVTYANMAALDRSDEADAVSNKVIGNSAVQSKQFADRDAMREVLGGELIREMILK